MPTHISFIKWAQSCEDNNQASFESIKWHFLAKGCLLQEVQDVRTQFTYFKLYFRINSDLFTLVGKPGLGLETAKRFYAEGASVILLDKNLDQLEAAKKLLSNASIVVVDLLDWDATRAALKNIGHVDHLVNNAGVNKRQPFMEVTPDAIDLYVSETF